MTPLAAIRSATTVAAECLGWADRVGSLRRRAGSRTSSPSTATRSRTSACSSRRWSSTRAAGSPSTAGPAESGADGVLLGIDHLVIAVRDPDAAADELAADLGLAVTGGGRHEHAGTFNRLAFLGDTYLELIGVFDRSLAAAPAAVRGRASRSAVLDDGREGLATWAVATDDVAAEVERLRAAGSPIGDVAAGHGRGPTARSCAGSTAFPVLGPDRPPFLIEHEPAGAEWGAEARAARAASGTRPAGRPVSITIPVPISGAAATAIGRGRDRCRRLDGGPRRPGRPPATPEASRPPDRGPRGERGGPRATLSGSASAGGSARRSG